MKSTHQFLKHHKIRYERYNAIRAIRSEQCLAHGYFMNGLSKSQAHQKRRAPSYDRPRPLSDRLSESKAKQRRTQIQYIFVCFLCLTVFCAVFEVFAAYTLIFCHKLDKGFLYWLFWTLLQVGSPISIFGISVAQLWALTGREALPVKS
ncbi:hypothetical protein DSL72_003466 [Monilinia vaccinii-corymbosi]|uniref:Uncharacterized protein n=1 Tax=Monilinia vaccinii-corymbosi TaxID=61207 RepID=A0A8A3P7Y9_9HELO|nr:hypothetical protein DSL72_003466 [Monilinia vaccinii-corymbosi]